MFRDMLNKSWRDNPTNAEFVYSIIIALIISDGISYLLRMIFIAWFIESEYFEKSMKISVIGKCLDFTPSGYRRTSGFVLVSI